MMTRSRLTESGPESGSNPESWALRDVYLAAAQESSPVFDVATTWSRLDRRLDRMDTKSVRNHSSWLRATIGISVAALGVVALGFIVFRPFSALSTENSASPQIVSTGPGERATITLPDGSKVTLGVASQIRYPEAFSPNARSVELDGEAVFTVMQHTGAPFVVRAGGVDTRVLGTTFNVRKYASDTAVKVTVAEGKVDVANTILTSGDQVIVGKNGSAMLTRESNIASALGWTTGRLTLDAPALRDVLPDLERWYGVTWHITDPRILSRSVRVVLEQENANEAAELIAFLVHARAVRTNNDTITLLPRKEPG